MVHCTGCTLYWVYTVLGVHYAKSNLLLNFPYGADATEYIWPLCQTYASWQQDTEDRLFVLVRFRQCLGQCIKRGLFPNVCRRMEEDGRWFPLSSPTIITHSYISQGFGLAVKFLVVKLIFSDWYSEFIAVALARRIFHKKCLKAQSPKFWTSKLQYNCLRRSQK